VRAEQHREDLWQAAAEEVVALAQVEEHATARQRRRERERVVDVDERIGDAVPDIDLGTDRVRLEARVARREAPRCR
jgi:hypothetical protein